MNELTHAFLLSVVVYDKTTGLFTRSGRKIGSHTKPKRSGNQYIQLSFFKKAYKAHRVAFFYVNGVWPQEEVDHINGDGTDNRWVNLRCCSRFENQRNKRFKSPSKHGIRGVRFRTDKKRWIASICGEENRIDKTFKSKIEAIEWRKKMELEMGYTVNHGDIMNERKDLRKVQ